MNKDLFKLIFFTVNDTTKLIKLAILTLPIK